MRYEDPLLTRYTLSHDLDDDDDDNELEDSDRHGWRR